ncbi:MAG: nicotinate (nicotinamide) nucleotide adenylyltransferase [Candidatus Omnitrophica bacterium]|nr:nicotinate (nicotinamide) nucleotide adenylyltransferase [Candidatus Omnitrophota bacterium]
MRLGIFGGTFNPIHIGHLLLAQNARETLRLDQVLFIPARIPPHKQTSKLLPASLRLKLVKLAIRKNPSFAVSDMELKRPGTSYTIDTVLQLRKQFPTGRFFLLIGSDLLAVRWRGWDKLRRLCTIVVAQRPGDNPSPRQPGVRLLPMPQLEIASSDIRDRLAKNRSIRYWVPEAVERALLRYGG